MGSVDMVRTGSGSLTHTEAQVRPDPAANNDVLLRMLTSSLGLRVEPVTPECDGPGPYVLPGSPVAVLDHARREVALAMRAAPLSTILAELSALSRRVAPRQAADEQAEAAAQLLLAKMLETFPADVAIAAIRGWPETPSGKWWPSDAELLAECEKRSDYRRRLGAAIDEALHAAKSSQGSERYGYEPVGRTRQLFEAAEAIRGRDWAFSWLNRRRCLFSDSEVVTTELGESILREALSGMANKLGVTIRTGAIADAGHGNATLGPSFGRPPAPVLEFLRRLREERGVDWVEAYTASARYTERAIHLRGIDFVRVRQKGGALAEACGIRIVEFR